MEVSVRELKNHLSRYLRRLPSVAEIVVTSRGKPVGRLLAPRPASGDPQADAIARLHLQPWLRPGTGRKVTGSNRPTSVRRGTTAEILRRVRGR